MQEKCYFCARYLSGLQSCIFPLSLIKKKFYDFKEKHSGITAKESYC